MVEEAEQLEVIFHSRLFSIIHALEAQVERETEAQVQRESDRQKGAWLCISIVKNCSSCCSLQVPLGWPSAPSLSSAWARFSWLGLAAATFPLGRNYPWERAREGEVKERRLKRWHI